MDPCKLQGSKDLPVMSGCQIWRVRVQALLSSFGGKRQVVIILWLVAVYLYNFPIRSLNRREPPPPIKMDSFYSHHWPPSAPFDVAQVRLWTHRSHVSPGTTRARWTPLPWVPSLSWFSWMSWWRHIRSNLHQSGNCKSKSDYNTSSSFY